MEVLRELPVTTLDRKPRMADFSRGVKALDSILDSKGLKTYLGLRGRIAQEVIEGDLVAMAVQDAVEKQDFEGTANELLEKLKKPDLVPKDWPTTPQGMAGALRRIGGPLRTIGIDVKHLERRTGEKRAGWKITYEHKRVRGMAPWHPQKKTLVLLDQVVSVLDRHAEYLPMTLRQVFYALVVMYDFQKTEQAYERLCEHMNRARSFGTDLVRRHPG